MLACKFCQSSTVVKNDVSRGKQRYCCKVCKHKFYDNGNSFARMRTPTHIIITSMNMLFYGLSVRKISGQIKATYDIEVSQVSIWSWIHKYPKLVSEYVQNLRLNLPGEYQHDETELRVGGESRWFWQMIDQGTRHLEVGLKK